MQIISLYSTPTSVPNPWKIGVALFYSLKPCPNQLSLKDSVRHSEKFLSISLLVSIPKERKFCDVS
jgi:hypothetical protein